MKILSLALALTVAASAQSPTPANGLHVKQITNHKLLNRTWGHGYANYFEGFDGPHRVGAVMGVEFSYSNCVPFGPNHRGQAYATGVKQGDRMRIVYQTTGTATEHCDLDVKMHPGVIYTVKNGILYAGNEKDNLNEAD